MITRSRNRHTECQPWPGRAPKTAGTGAWRRSAKLPGALLIFALISMLLAGCGGKTPTAPVEESAAEDMTEETAQAAATEAAAAEEEPVRITTETALAGICLARTENGDNDRLLQQLQEALVLRGFSADHIMEQEMTDSRTRQSEEIDECLSEGCSLLIVSAVSDERIPDMVDRVAEAQAQVLFVNCRPDDSEIDRWNRENLPAVWLGTTYAQELSCQMSILYDYSGSDRGLDFNEDGHIGVLLIGGGEEARSALEEAVHDLGTQIQILGETDSRDAEEISSYTQEILNEHKKACELVLCSTEDAVQAAADGVQLRHRLVGRDILVIGAGTHEDTCTAIVNKLISGSTFTDFYEQGNLAAVAAKDMIEGNQTEKTIANVVFKVTEDNAQEVLDQLWKTRADAEEARSGDTAETAEEDPAGDSEEDLQDGSEDDGEGSSGEEREEDREEDQE